RNTLFDKFRCSAKKTIATLDVVIEKVERFTRLYCFQPKSNFTQLHGHRIDIDTVNTVANDLAERMSQHFRTGLSFSSAEDRKSPGYTLRSRDEKMAAAAGGIADIQGEHGFIGGFETKSFEILNTIFKNRVESTIQ